jgi:hypothetical protein
MTDQEIGSLIYATAFGEGMPANLCALIEAQSKHESDSFSSHAFINNNNCFGYKFEKSSSWQDGKGITSSEGDHYAHYVDIQHSTIEICHWIKRRQKEKKFPQDLSTIKTPTDYATLLKQCGYFGDSLQHYITGISHFLNNEA